MPTEMEMIEQLRRGKVSLPPLSFRLLEREPELVKNVPFDALVEASWGEGVARFRLECKALSTPKAFRDGLNILKTSLLPEGYLPMLFLPFLSGHRLLELERKL